MYNLPEELKQIVEEAFKSMESHPYRNLFNYYRDQIYASLRAYNGSNKTRTSPTAGWTTGRSAVGWLAILAAEKVMPIYEAGPDELKDDIRRSYGLPPDLLKRAREIIEGVPAIEQDLAIVSDAHEIYGYASNESEFDPENFPANCVLAAFAAKAALAAATGHDSFAYSKNQARWRGEVWPVPPDKETGELDPKDLRLIGGSPDAAGYAAAAWYTGARPDVWDFAKLREFWTWWLTEAIPMALEVAER